MGSAQRLLTIVGVVLLLAVAFAGGALINNLGSRSRLTRERSAPIPVDISRERVASRELGDLTLVPVSDPTSTIGQSITSAPIPDPDHKGSEESERADATALPSEQYSRVLEQSGARPSPTPDTVDPRSLPGGLPRQAIAERPRASGRSMTPQDEPETSGERAAGEEMDEITETRPSPISQPLPDLDQIHGSGTLRLLLTIGRDGSVKEVKVRRAVEGITGKVIEKVQRWKFRPATRNGEPVDGSFEVDISFNEPER